MDTLPSQVGNLQEIDFLMAYVHIVTLYCINFIAYMRTCECNGWVWLRRFFTEDFSAHMGGISTFYARIEYLVICPLELLM